MLYDENQKLKLNTVRYHLLEPFLLLEQHKEVNYVKKRLLSFGLAVALAVGMTVCASAAEPQVEPRLLQVHTVLNFTGTTANCEAMITSASDDIEATMTLKQGNRVVDSWSGSSTGILFLDGDCYVTKGVTYTLTVEGTRNGVAFEATPITRTC